MAARRRASEHAQQAFDLGYTSQAYENAVMLEQAGNLEVAEELHRTAQASSIRKLRRARPRLWPVSPPVLSVESYGRS